MRIRELKLIRYGKFTDRHLSLPRQPRDIHLIVGPNEAGKSTVRSAIGDWLFGIPVRTPLAFLHPMSELRVGGVLERVADASQDPPLAFDRTKGNKNTVRSPQDAVLPDAMLQPWLGGLQLNAFQRMYALDHSTLVEGGAGILSASDDVGRLLFQSAAGIEGLAGVLQKLEAEADSLFASRKSGARVYYQAQEAYEAAGAQLKQVVLKAKDWKAQHDALQSTEQAIADARQQEKATRQQLSQLERIRRVRPMLQALDAAHAQKESLGLTDEVPLLPENASSTIRDAAHAMAMAQADRQRLEQQASSLRTQLEAIRVDQTLLSLAADITDLHERRLQYRSHRTDIAKRGEEIQTHWSRVQELVQELGWAADTEEAVRKRLPAAAVRNRLAGLLKDKGALAQQLRGAQASLDDKAQQIDQAQQALARLGAREVNPNLAGAVERALKLGDHAAALSQLAQKVETLNAELEAAKAGLGKWRAEPVALAAMLVPEDAAVQGLVDESRNANAEVQAMQEALAEKTQELQRLELELQHFVQDFQPVSREQVEEARQARDKEWQAIKAAPSELAAKAGPYEQWVTKADVLADDRLLKADHEATRRSKAERIEHVRLEQQMHEVRLQGAQGRQEERKRQWEKLAGQCGLPELPLEAAPAWLRQRRAVLEMSAEFTRLEQQRKDLQATGSELATTIWSMLGEPNTEAQAPSLQDCLQRARALLTMVEQARGQHSTLEEQLAAAQSSLPRLQSAMQQAQTGWTDWESSWQAAVEAAGYDGATKAEQVEAEAEAIQEVDRLLGLIRKIRTERIEPMQMDLDDLKASAEALASRAATDLAQQDADAIAQELFARLASTQQADKALRELRVRHSQVEAELADAGQRHEAQAARLAPLMAAAGVDDVNALAAAAQQSEQRREIDSRIAAAQSDLVHSGDGMSLDQLREEAQSIAPDELVAEIERLGSVSAQLVEQIAQLSTQQGTQRKAFEALDGTAAAATADARRQEAVASMADAAERYLKLHTTARLLKWSMEKFRETRQGPMLAKASSTFSALTLGSFERLLVDSGDQTPRLYGIRHGGTQVEVSGMSEGSRDQLYLALRLAALELQIEQGLNIPLIADDLFINFDDGRTAAGLRVLGELSQKMQVIFLTHHDHLVPLAREVLGGDLNVVTL
ncbi:hypothetical protein PMI14_01972 [Acidovorax sp. CF316]|uniref:ATP-binding protein n=1 Tax=Acidovorax sp. CF316 TaxID=1144317 RepID=UPI00026BD357|nr:YhaN family protein [Acidovorax sp. CF316]EJE53372.1 hypothetical protein PMI14_01972 [Acidovorax sp. CF316]